MNSRIQKLFGFSAFLAAASLLLAFAVQPAAARGDKLRVYRQGLDVDIEDDGLPAEDVTDILDSLDGMMEIELLQGAIGYLLNMSEAVEMGMQEEMIAENEEGIDEDGLGIETDSEDSDDDESVGINDVGIQDFIPGCSKPDPPTEAPLVCDDEGKGKKGGKKSGDDDDDDGGKKGKGRGKKSSDDHYSHGKTFLEVRQTREQILQLVRCTSHSVCKFFLSILPATHRFLAIHSLCCKDQIHAYRNSS